MASGINVPVMKGVNSSVFASILSKQRKKRNEYKFDDTTAIGEGTYGIVYKATRVGDPKSKYAVKLFKKFKSHEGLTASAIREITLLRELRHPNIVNLVDVLMDADNSSLYLVFDYAEYDLFDMVKPPASQQKVLPLENVRVIMWQLLNGLNFMHKNWVIHRDLKPSNVLVMGEGSEKNTVKIADFGLARIFQSPLKSLAKDGVVVTIWYRAPELLLGAAHYTPAVDIWAAGCIFAELMTCSPLFRGEERKQSATQFQDDQVAKIFDVLGTPKLEDWPTVEVLPHWNRVENTGKVPRRLAEYLKTKLTSSLSRADISAITPAAVDLLGEMLRYDPNNRITAEKAMQHRYFHPNSTGMYTPDSSTTLPALLNEMPSTIKFPHYPERRYIKVKTQGYNSRPQGLSNSGNVPSAHVNGNPGARGFPNSGSVPGTGSQPSGRNNGMSVDSLGARQRSTVSTTKRGPEAIRASSASQNKRRA
eukprot:Rmarinus@m.9277